MRSDPATLSLCHPAMKVVSSFIDDIGLNSKRREMDLAAKTFESADKIMFASAKDFHATWRIQ
jgi:hypothetical protein